MRTLPAHRAQAPDLQTLNQHVFINFKIVHRHRLIVNNRRKTLLTLMQPKKRRRGSNTPPEEEEGKKPKKKFAQPIVKPPEEAQGKKPIKKPAQPAQPALDDVLYAQVDQQVSNVLTTLFAMIDR